MNNYGLHATWLHSLLFSLKGYIICTENIPFIFVQELTSFLRLGERQTHYLGPLCTYEILDITLK